MDKIAAGFANVTENIISLVSEKVLPALVNDLAWITDNSDILIPIIVTAGSAVAAYQVSVFGAAAAQKILNTAISLNPYALVISTVAALTAGLLSLAGASERATQKLKDNAAESYNGYETQKEKVSELETELEGVCDRITEIQSKGQLTLTDEQELENLREQNTELSTRLEIEKQLLELKKQQSNSESYKAIMSENGGIADVKSKLSQYNTNLEYAQDQLEYWEGELQTALKKNDLDDAETARENIDFYKGDIENLKIAVMEGLHEVTLLTDGLDTTTESGKEATKAVEDLKKEVYAGLGIQEEPVYTLGTPDYKSPQQMADEEYAKNYTSVMQQQADEIAETQAEINGDLASEWKRLEHNYAIGVIASEKDLYAQKSALLEQYGNADLEDHWKYYEDLHKMESDFAKQSAEDAKKAAEDHKKQITDEWNSIERMQSMGVLSTEDAYKKRLEFIEKYCAEYSDEWYEYYQTIIEYQQQSLEKQIDTAKENIKKLVAEYKSAYSDLESDMKSYKNRLLSVGDLFSVDKNKNGKTTVTVENMRKQMAEMQKYHDYVSKLKSRGASRELISELTSMDFKEGSFTAKNLANMSDADFKEINDLYTKKQKLADKLSKELYEPEMQKLNDDLAKGVINEFRKLSPEIQEIGAEALRSFIDGLSAGDISENVNNFTEKFAADCKTGIEKAFEDTELNFSALMKNDNYSIGKSAGEEYVKGFNEAMERIKQVQFAAASEQAYMSGSAASEKQYRTAGSDNYSGKKEEKIVLKNYVNTTVELDKKVVGKTSYEYEKEHKRRTDT